MWRRNYSVTAFSHHPEHRPPSFCQTPRQHRFHAIAEQQQHGNMSPDRLTCNVTLSLTRMDDLKGLLLWGGSCLTCIVKTNSQCLSSHDEGINTFQFQQATIFTATLLFQPQLFTTMYIQLQMIIYKSSVCCFTHMHTDIISYTTYSWDARNLQTCP